MKDIIVTFTVVPALHKVVYLLWLSTFKDKGKRNSKNVCHGGHMVNSKSTMFSRNVTVVVLFNSQVSVFDNSSCFYNRVRQSDSQFMLLQSSQTVRQSDSQTVKPVRESYRQTVRQSNSQTVRESDCQTVRQSDGQTVTQSHSQKVRESDCQAVRESDCQAVRESDRQVVRESVSQLVYYFSSNSLFS